MDAPKIVQIDSAAATVHNHAQTAWGALREDGSVVWKVTGCGTHGPDNWSKLQLPDSDIAITQVTISCSVEHDNLITNMTLLFADGTLAHSWSNLRSHRGWQFDRETAAAQAS